MSDKDKCSLAGRPCEDSIEDLKKSNRILKEVFAANKMYVWSYDFVTGKIKFSDEYFQMLELDKEGIHFADIHEMMQFVHPDDRQYVNEQTFNEKLKNCREGQEIIVRYMGNDGSVVYVSDRFFEIERDEKGKALKLRSFSKNITEQYKLDFKLKAQEDFNAKIIEIMPEFVFIFDSDLIVRDVMISDRPFFHTKEEIVGMDGKKFYSPKTQAILFEAIHGVLADGKVRTVEYDVQTNGFNFYYQARIAPYGDHLAMALIRDITADVERSKELEEAKKHAEDSDKAKSIFLANISHEIRTPLNAIVGFSEILVNAESNTDKKECVNMIKTNSKLLLQLINDVLDLARLQSGKVTMNIAPVELNCMVKEIARMHATTSKGEVEIRAEVPTEAIVVNTDSNRVTQVIFNFVTNAFKNTDRGTVTIGLTDEGKEARIYVKDTGHGIPQDKLKAIFDSFVKLNEFVQGTGLGLSICKDIAQKLGARLGVESELGKGSTFSILLKK